jgi:aminoglycoside phosphotransferase (APT) family kinase protein
VAASAGLALTSTFSDRLAEVVGAPLTEQPRQLSGGASRETWSFAAGGRPLIAQLQRVARDPPRAPQAPLLRAAAAAGVPVAEVVADGADDEVLGVEWTILEALPGTADARAILDANGPALLDEVAGALAPVHRMPAPAEAPVDVLAELRGMHDSLGQDHPVFEVAFAELERSRPAPGPRGFVHGDFRMGNLLVDGDRLTAVLDWELAHSGDQLEDLGWLCVRAWRFHRPDRPAAGLGTREELAAAYARHAGVSVAPETLAWWELFGTLRWGVITVLQRASHPGSLEHAVIGRRTAEVEWDLLDLLDPGGAALEAPPGEAPASLHDAPSATELIERVRGALGDDLLPQLEGRDAFQLRVALRALGIVRRELEHDAEHRAIAEAVRDRDDYPALRALVRAKLEAANPRHLEEP